VSQDKPDGTGLVACYAQKEPARQLPNLQKIPILVLSSEASYYAPYDQSTFKYLQQAGVKPSFIRLVDRGSKGNNHFMMMEKTTRKLPQSSQSGCSRLCRPRSENKHWRKVLAYITGTVDEDLLLRNEYQAAENRILMKQLKGRLRLTDRACGHRVSRTAWRTPARLLPRGSLSVLLWLGSNFLGRC